nr:MULTISPECIES: substrate-binding domain-containing protein [unclassified Actinomyces]
MGYESPSAPARTEPVVTIVFDTLDTFYTNRVLAGAVTAAAEAGVLLNVTAFSDPDAAGSDTWIRRLAAAGHLGLVIVTRELTRAQTTAIRETGLPTVTVDPVQDVPTDVLAISSANWNGGMSATQYLLGLGHQRIGFVAGPASSLPARERLLGYRTALLDAGLDAPAELVRGQGFRYETGLEAGTALLTLPEDRRPTAIMAASDVAAMGVYEAARRAGLSVPEDLSVVGYDDTFLAECAAPPLTTIHQALETMGARAIEAALDLAAGTTRTVGTVQIPTHLVERASTAPPRSRG